MTRYAPHLATHFDGILQVRESELRALLKAVDEPPIDDRAVTSHDVLDTKDVAEQDATGALDAAQAERAAHELEDVLLARHRLAIGEFGTCLECGEPLELQRLEAVPAARHCVACQAAAERAVVGHREPTRH